MPLFLQWFRSKLLSRACTCFCDVHYSYLTAEVITGNAFLYEENYDTREVQGTSDVFFLIIYLLIYISVLYYTVRFDFFFFNYGCAVAFWCIVEEAMILFSVTICVYTLYNDLEIALRKRCRNRCVCFHAKNPDTIISARGEFRRTTRLCHPSLTEFQEALYGLPFRKSSIFLYKRLFVVVVCSTALLNLRLEWGFIVRTVLVITTRGAWEMDGKIQVVVSPCAFPIANLSPPHQLWPLPNSSSWYNWWQGAGLVGGGSCSWCHHVGMWHILTLPMSRLDVQRTVCSILGALCPCASSGARVPGVLEGHWLQEERFLGRSLGWDTKMWQNLKVAMQESWRKWTLTGVICY